MLFSRFGPATIVKRCRGYLYVKFTDPEVVSSVKASCHVVEGAPLTVEPAVAKKKTWYCQVDPRFPVRVRRLGEGIVQIQNMISMALQKRLAHKVLRLGESPAGFYRPSFGGREMHLSTFCLGRHWDTQSHSYSDTRLDCDGLPVLALPTDLLNLANGIQHDLNQKCNEQMFPQMRPEACIVNHYTTEGSLGLHQDLDESASSLEDGIPVISMSLGCSARFAFAMDGHETRSCLLKSGDIFIFGGQARLLHHGIAKVFPNTTPRKLKADMEDRPGRLNLTFRQVQ